MMGIQGRNVVERLTMFRRVLSSVGCVDCISKDMVLAGVLI